MPDPIGHLESKLTSRQGRQFCFALLKFDIGEFGTLQGVLGAPLAVEVVAEDLAELLILLGVVLLLGLEVGLAARRVRVFIYI